MFTFYLVDITQSGKMNKVYSASTYTDPQEAKTDADKVSLILGGKKYEIEKLQEEKEVPVRNLAFMLHSER